MTKRIQTVKPRIQELFDSLSIKAFRKLQIAEIYRTYWLEWRLPRSLTFTKFLDFLLSETELKEITLTSDHYKDETRYVWRRPSIYAIGLSLRHDAYLTHGSAVSLHDLTDQILKTVYVNYEQSPKPQGSGLTQEAIDRAFANRQRQSNLIYHYEEFQFVVINGKFTNRLEVSQIPGSDGELLDVTKLERTLIDIAVRPNYAGGAFQVLNAFQQARSRISVNTLVATLKKLNYVYPYHQVIGFYMERAGYPESQWQKLMKLGLSFDFYLTYQLPSDKKYDPKWRLYYPNSL